MLPACKHHAATASLSPRELYVRSSKGKRGERSNGAARLSASPSASRKTIISAFGSLSTANILIVRISRISSIFGRPESRAEGRARLGIGAAGEKQGRAGLRCCPSPLLTRIQSTACKRWELRLHSYFEADEGLRGVQITSWG